MTKNTRLNFTKRSLEALPPAAAGKRGVYLDTQVKGLNLIVTDKGNKSFYLRKVINGKSRRIRIGAFPDYSVENARTKAQQLRTAIAEGKDPHKEVIDAKNEHTLSAFFEVYMERYAELHKKHAYYDREQFERHIKPKFGSEKLSQITREEVRRFHADLGVEKRNTANKMLSLLRMLYNKASEWGYFRGENPTQHIKKFREVSRDRFLQKDEIPRFFEALAEEPSADIRDYVLISLLTGARKSNVLTMRWQDVDLDSGTWRIPETKNGEPLTLPLVPQVVEILKARKPKKKATYVLPGAGKAGHMVEPKRGWQRILTRAEIDDLRLHDLRRTLGSYQAMTGASLSIIGKSLGHKSHAATQVYARLNIDPVRESVGSAVDLMMALKEKKKDE